MKTQIILSIGMPRAGSAWYYNLTHDLVVAAGGADARRVREKYHLQRFITEINCLIPSLSFHRLLPVMLPSTFEAPYVINSHAGRKPLSDIFIKLGLIKPTFIYRDPRDVALSAFEYGQHVPKNRKAFLKGLNFFSQFSTIDDAIYFMKDYLLVAEGWLTCSQTLIVRYEDLLQNFDQEAQRLIGFLEMDTNTPGLDEVLEKYNPASKSSREKGTHFVKGKIGRYREAFTEEQKALSAEIFGPYLEAQGYEIGE